MIGLVVQEAAKAKEAAKRAREAEVFILNPQGAPTTYTVPKPFKLHETTNQVSTVSVVGCSPCRDKKKIEFLHQQMMDTVTSGF